MPVFQQGSGDLKFSMDQQCFALATLVSRILDDQDHGVTGRVCQSISLLHIVLKKTSCPSIKLEILMLIKRKKKFTLLL